ARLDPAEFDRVSTLLTPVPLSFKEKVSHQDRPTSHFFFPESGVLSFVTNLEGGGIVETGTVGNEGFTDVSAFLGMPRAPASAFCQIPGHALRMSVEALRSERAQNTPLIVLMSRFAGAFIAMLAQTAACNRAHPVDERMARWLLMTHDRVDGNAFPLTQEFL